MKFSEKIRNEAYAIIPAVIYFALIFNAIHFISTLALRPGEEPYYSYLTVTIWSLFVGKMLIVLNVFSFVNAFSAKPLIYNITWKFFLYSFSAFIFRILDILIHERIRYGNFEAACNIVSEHLMHPMFWALQLALMLTFLAFVIFSEMARVLGKQAMLKMLFG